MNISSLLSCYNVPCEMCYEIDVSQINPSALQKISAVCNCTATTISIKLFSLCAVQYVLESCGCLKQRMKQGMSESVRVVMAECYELDNYDMLRI